MRIAVLSDDCGTRHFPWNYRKIMKGHPLYWKDQDWTHIHFPVLWISTEPEKKNHKRAGKSLVPLLIFLLSFVFIVEKEENDSLHFFRRFNEALFYLNISNQVILQDGGVASVWNLAAPVHFWFFKALTQETYKSLAPATSHTTELLLWTNFSKHYPLNEKYFCLK